VVTAAGELLDGTLDYDRALRDSFAALLAAHAAPRRRWSTSHGSTPTPNAKDDHADLPN
jgi:hypothetical protein